MNERDQRRGHGRDLQRGKRATFNGIEEFHKGFVKGELPKAKRCELCESGDPAVKLKRKWVHYMNRRIIPCQR